MASPPKAATPPPKKEPEPVPVAPAIVAPAVEPKLEPEPLPQLEPEPEPVVEDALTEPEPEPEVVSHVEALEISVSPSAPDIQPRARSRLISEATEIASSAALSVLAQVVQPGRGFTEEGRRMMDQIMRERLEEHLRSWMDANLPGLVERIVREEITSLVERSLGRRG